MQECLELLGVIGELVFEQGEKIQQIKDRVVEANAHL